MDMPSRWRTFSPNALFGKVVLVTGATGGIGRAAAAQLMACGATIAISASHGGRLDELACMLGVYAVPGDIRSADGCACIIDSVVARHKRLDGLVNCAGVWTEGHAQEVMEAEWDRCMDVNLKGLFFLCSRAIPALKESRGAIINLSSDAGVVGNAGSAVYCASKGGVTLMSKALALELAPHGVRVNALCPGDVLTPMLAAQALQYGGTSPAGYLRRLLDRYPQNESARFITVDEVAHMIVFLLSDTAEPITGAALSMDFGISAGY